jgi:kinesin family protein 2/24
LPQPHAQEQYTSNGGENGHRNGNVNESGKDEGKEGAEKEKEERICIAVRKRPVSSKEIAKNDYDSVTCLNPLVIVHDCKLRVDGITKYLDNTPFSVDHTFHEEDTTDDIYKYCVKSLVPFTVAGGRGTVFAYGQTGSGKTYTMCHIQQMAIRDLYLLLEVRARDRPDSRPLVPYVSFFEIYGGRCQDLLNNRNRLAVREDGTGDVVIAGLFEEEARGEEEMMAVIDLGNRNRTTHATESNDESSRSHAICQIVLRFDTADGESGPVYGKLSLIDLAGSERGADTKSHNRQRRLEGAEINKSLLALKECIRALDGGSTHVPYRGSKLTLVLKDSFTRARAKTVMIATVSPSASSADHTLNTLRYADRIKERSVPVVMLEPVENPAAAAAAAAAAAGLPQPPSSSSSDNKQSMAAPPKERRRTMSGAGAGAVGVRKASHSPVRPSEQTSNADRRSRRSSDVGAGGVRTSVKAMYAGAGGGGGSEYHSSSHRGRDRVDSDLRASTERERSLAEHKAQAAEFGPLGSPTKRDSTRDSRDSRDSRDGRNRRDKNSADEEEYSMKAMEDHQNTVEVLFEEEEQLLNMHMAVIQENAELLTDEGRLLQAMQGESVVDDDVDRYASELDAILGRKLALIDQLQGKLGRFRESLKREEEQSMSISISN